VFDPCISMRAHGHEYASNDHAFGVFDDMVAYLERILTERRYAAGDRFTAADVQLASGIEFTMNIIKVLPERRAFSDYLERIGLRPALIRSKEIDTALARTVPALQEMFAS
jgi:glutathione S-transferase